MIDPGILIVKPRYLRSVKTKPGPIILRNHRLCARARSTHIPAMVTLRPQRYNLQNFLTACIEDK